MKLLDLLKFVNCFLKAENTVSARNLTDLSAPKPDQTGKRRVGVVSKPRHARYRAEHRVLCGANLCDERARGNALHAAHMLWV